MNNNPSESKEWKKLRLHADKLAETSIKKLFEEDPQRADKFSTEFEGIFFDYSKNTLTEESLRLLTDTAVSVNLKQETEKMFTGEKINRTENRAVLHTLLRDFSVIRSDKETDDNKKKISESLDKMKSLSDSVRSGQLRGFTGKSFKNIVNIGIGGSDLGPRMVCRALKYYSQDNLNISFISNIDPAESAEILMDLNPEETIFLICSKTFTTLETMSNANIAKEWICRYFMDDNSFKKHFVAITASPENAEKYGIEKDKILEFWEWIGGRFSICSAIGFSVMVMTGHKNFTEFLKGFHSMDLHFRNSEYSCNIPVLMALTGFFYNNFLGRNNHAVIPYSSNLEYFSMYLQQADMESNGKNRDRQGLPVKYNTGPVIWGGTGTNSQHAFFQLLHQGTVKTSSDFIGFANSPYSPVHMQDKLIANMFAQTRALAFGKPETNSDRSEKDKFRKFTGNIPSNTILIRELSPYTLGQLISMYEHKIFTQGILWNIFSFDQWGVELGKQLFKTISPAVSSEENIETGLDSSTENIIRKYKLFRK